MVLLTTLKKRHCLKGRNLLPAIRKLQDGAAVKGLARMMAGSRTEDLLFRDVEKYVLELTDEVLGDLLILAGRDRYDLEGARLLLHYLIVLANEKGQPQGQDLTDEDVGTSTTTQSNTAQGSGVNCVPTGCATVASHVQQPNKRLKTSTLEERISVLEHSMVASKVADLKERRCGKDHRNDGGFIHIPKWELESGFNPTAVKVREKPVWVTLEGGIPLPDAHTMSYNSQLHMDFDINTIPLRNPLKFVAGQLHSNLSAWEDILQGYNEEGGRIIKRWLQDGVDIFDFFQYFKGSFKGRAFDSSTPPVQYLANSGHCKDHIKFIVRELYNRIESGSISLLGKIGEVTLPKVIMPLLVEPTKPRLCHDERYLNLWIKDSPFKLETLKDIHRMVDKNAYMFTLDDKSGYDHILLSERSRDFFGIQFGGYIMTYRSLPFGWRASPYVYQSVGMVVTDYFRKKGILNSQYIDDRLGVSAYKGANSYIEARRVVYMMLQVLTRLGYTLALSKCSFEPSTIKRFLGFFRRYLLPEDKKVKFVQLREEILTLTEVDVRTLQRFCGKCISMCIAVPGCKLFCREINRAISVALKSSKRVPISGPIREELEHWRFLDTWGGGGCMKWRPEYHKVIKMSTDSSGYRYGAVVELNKKVTMGDFWGEGASRPIHTKEADAVLKTLVSLGKQLENSCVDLNCDNMAVVSVWEKGGGRDSSLTDIIKAIFYHTSVFNIDLCISYVPSGVNEADTPSQTISLGDSMLTEKVWGIVQDKYGPHTIDLMALDSNAMKTKEGTTLRHFTPWPTPKSSGVNVFTQNLRLEGNPYVFPTFALIFPLLCFLEEQRVSATVVIPKIQPLPMWWPKLQQLSRDEVETVDWQTIDDRLRDLDHRLTSSPGYKRKSRVLKNFLEFLSFLPNATMDSCSPQDVKRFLIWKDDSGKTVVHNVGCANLGSKEQGRCNCPTRLAAGTVEGIVYQLVSIFDDHGYGRRWDPISMTGNPAASPSVASYLKLVQEEQAKAHILPKQAKPIFLTKVKAISLFIKRELQRTDLSKRDRYVLHRDQAWFKLQFFAGDRASDLSVVVTQEIKVLDDDSGLVFHHTFGKTLRGSKGRSNTFVIKACDDKIVCPVTGLLDFLRFAKNSGVDLTTGYLFRIVSDNSRVLDTHMSYSVVYERLRYYLVTLGLYEGETPHSFRSGCAVTMALSGAVDSTEQMMSHLGWFTKDSAEYYGRLHTIADSTLVASRLSKSTIDASRIEREFNTSANFSALRNLNEIVD